MNSLFILLFAATNLIVGGGDAPNSDIKPVDEFAIAVPTPQDASGCVEENYRHKSKAALAAMTPRQLMDENVKEQLYHAPALDDLYSGDLINKYITKAGIDVLPVLTDFMNAYDPQNASKCEFTRFIVAMEKASEFDIGLMRLRGIRDGQLAIESLEKAVERMKEAGFDKGENPHKGYLDLPLLNLEAQKGINVRDWLIGNALKLRHRIQMSDDELLEFSNFLISMDPTYPTWSGVKMSGSLWVVKRSDRYYKAYLRFKSAKKSGTNK